MGDTWTMTKECDRCGKVETYSSGKGYYRGPSEPELQRQRNWLGHSFLRHGDDETVECRYLLCPECVDWLCGEVKVTCEVPDYGNY